MDIKKPIILAVDDQPVILHIIASELRELYQVKPLTSGQALFKYFEKQSADLILLDYDMPGMSGFEVFEKLRSDVRFSDIPVIFFTGSINENTEIEVLEKGACDYIQKPIKSRVLQTRIQLHLELIQYRKHMKLLVEEHTEQLQRLNSELKQREKFTLNLLKKITRFDTSEYIKRTNEIINILINELQNKPESGLKNIPDENELI